MTFFCGISRNRRVPVNGKYFHVAVRTHGISLENITFAIRLQIGYNFSIPCKESESLTVLEEIMKNVKFLGLLAALILLTVPVSAANRVACPAPPTAVRWTTVRRCPRYGFRLPDAFGVPDSATPAANPDASGAMSAYESEVVRLVNEIRARYGLSALSADNELARVARLKSQDMRDKGYFSHESPTYGTPFQMLKSFGISYRAAGENIAYGYATPQSVVDAWMNSDGHRANILNASYTRLGVGYVANGHYWTQLFAG